MRPEKRGVHIPEGGLCLPREGPSSSRPTGNGERWRGWEQGPGMVRYRDITLAAPGRTAEACGGGVHGVSVLDAQGQS